MKSIAAVFSILLVAFCGCTNVAFVDHSYDPKFNLLEYRTFDLLPNPHGLTNELAVAVLGEDDISLVALRAVLEAKGFKYAEAETPDFVIGVRAEIGLEKPEAIGVVVEDGLIFSAWEGSIANSRQPDAVELRSNETEYSIRSSGVFMDQANVSVSMSVEVYDTDARVIVWKGWATAQSLKAFKSDESRLRIVNQIMQSFPN